MTTRIGIIGTGYLGATHAACMAELGFETIGLDTDPDKVQALNDGRLPFFEPALGDMLARHTASGRLCFTTSAAETAEHADVHFVCVGTPQRRGGMAADTTQVFAAVESLVPHLNRHALLVGKSTVPVGTARELAALADRLAATGVEVEVAWNPEFLREGHAVADTLRPDRLVFGVGSAEAEKTLRVVYASLLDDGVPLVVTDIVTSELVKVAANAFLATKISFANAMSELCEAAGGDVVALTDALGRDDRIGRRFLAAGLGFGGGCLPKDIRALMARAGELGVDQALTFLREVDAINMRRRHRMVQLAIEECGGSVLGRRIAVLGAAFKPQTDDVRDSPALNVAAQLQLQGAQVEVFDPQANANAARLFPTLAYAESARAVIEGAHLVLHLTEWPEFAALDPAELRGVAAHPRIVDGRNTLDADRWRQAGWSYRALGRPRPT
ncbi:MAG TPA: UDP-glucose/GDP-mannose dehydrogenase family protein [Nocardioidaceae bacterium]|nr:UDP-glucose/GDP-mannose dehydrogenase family protein [Nocardioidaceae bacterium]